MELHKKLKRGDIIVGINTGIKYKIKFKTVSGSAYIVEDIHKEEIVRINLHNYSDYCSELTYVLKKL